VVAGPIHPQPAEAASGVHRRGDRAAASRGEDPGYRRWSRCAIRGRATIIALDISEQQISANHTVDFGIVADACKGFPMDAGTIDVAVTRSLLEHLPDPRVTVREIARVLRPNGVCIHLFPSRFAPFALLNRLIPSKLGRLLLLGVFPEFADSSGFPAFYRDCDATTMKRLHEAAELKVRLIELRYYEAIYYKFFVPFYLIMVLYDYLAYLIGSPRLACQVLMVADKPAAALPVGAGSG
jgi:SAM-dependent methyltransferase